MNKEKISRAHRMLRHIKKYQGYYKLLELKPMTVTELWVASKVKNHNQISLFTTQGERLGLLTKTKRGKEKVCAITQKTINRINHFTSAIL